MAPRAAGLVSGGFVFSSGGVDGHVNVEGRELAEVTADLAVAPGPLVVPVGPRSVNLAAGSARRCQMMIRMDLPTAHMALALPGAG